MTIDYDYARTFFDIIMIFPFAVHCLYLLYIFLSRFCSYSTGHFWGHGVQGARYWAYQCIWAGIRSSVFTKSCLTGAHTTQEIHHMRGANQSNIAYAATAICYSGVELQSPLHMRDSCTALHVAVNTCATCSTVSRTPCIRTYGSRTVVSHFEGPVCTVHKQRLTSNARHGIQSQTERATSTCAQLTHEADVRILADAARTDT